MKRIILIGAVIIWITFVFALYVFYVTWDNVPEILNILSSLKEIP